MNNSTRKWLILIGTGISSMLIAVDYSIANVALANIQHALNMKIAELQWVMAGFGLTFCSFLVTMGRLGDLFGRRLFLYIGIIGFGLASLGAGLATTGWQLILFRLLQGALGASIYPSGMALVSEAFLKHERGRALGIYGALGGFGLALGPAIGGIIVSFLGWRWIFFINIPVILISFTICLTVLKESKATEKTPIDWWGMILITLTLSALLIAITQGQFFGWTSILIVSLFIIAIISASLLILVEAKSQAPLLPIKLFNNRGFIAGTLCFIGGAGLAWPISFFAPLYLLKVLDYDPYITGLLLLPMTAMTMIVPAIAGHVYDKRGPLMVAASLFLFTMTSFLLQTFFSTTSPVWFVVTALMVFGIGWGVANGISTPIVLSRIENNKDVGVISGAAITLFNVVGILSLAIVGTIFSYAEKARLLAQLAKHNIQLSSQQTHLVSSLLSDPTIAKSKLAQINPQLADTLFTYFKQAFVHGYQMGILYLLLTSVFVVIAVFVALRK